MYATSISMTWIIRTMRCKKEIKEHAFLDNVMRKDVVRYMDYFSHAIRKDVGCMDYARDAMREMLASCMDYTGQAMQRKRNRGTCISFALSCEKMSLGFMEVHEERCRVNGIFGRLSRKHAYISLTPLNPTFI